MRRKKTSVFIEEFADDSPVCSETAATGAIFGGAPSTVQAFSRPASD
jgi:hypothetical protein